MIIFYFSGTGNSYWTAQEIGKQFSADVTSIVNYLSEKEVTVTDDVIGIVAPTHIIDVPWIMKEFLLKISAVNKPYIFAVMTSNNGKSGKAFENIDRALKHKNMQLSLAFDLQMPGNCVMSTTEENEQRLYDAPKIISDICNSITERKINTTPTTKKINPRKFAKITILNSVITHFKVNEKCSNCGQCIKICPTNSIESVNGKAVHHKKCAACYSCLHWCPQHAIIVNVPTFKNMIQYHHPEVSFNDMFYTQNHQVK